MCTVHLKQAEKLAHLHINARNVVMQLAWLCTNVLPSITMKLPNKHALSAYNYTYNFCLLRLVICKNYLNQFSGVHQGCVLWPFLFNTYMLPLFQLCKLCNTIISCAALTQMTHNSIHQCHHMTSPLKQFIKQMNVCVNHLFQLCYKQCLLMEHWWIILLYCINIWNFFFFFFGGGHCQAYYFRCILTNFDLNNNVDKSNVYTLII